MPRLNIGESVPQLSGNTLSGKSVALSDYRGTPLILSFYRYAGCQLCNLRIHDFIKHFEAKYESAGIQALAVFQSPLRKMKKYTTEHHAPFEFVSDPEYDWYEAFGLENSWTGFARGLTKPIQITRSITNGFLRIDPDGSMNRLPADFLIGPDGVIQDLFYGKHIGDHISFRRIDRWMNQKVLS